MFSFNFHFVVVLFFISITTSKKTIPLEITYILSSVNSRILFEKEHNSKIFEIDLNSTYSFATPMFYKKTSYSEIIETGKMSTRSNNDTPYELIKEEVRLPDRNLYVKDFFFYYIDNHNVKKYDSLGFGYKVLDNRTHIIYNLFNQNLIDELSLGITRIHKQNGYIHLGGFPDSFPLRPYSFTCQVNQIMPNWGCIIKDIYLNDTVFHNKYHSYFQMGNRGIAAPIEYFAFLTEQIFKEAYDNKRCQSSDLIFGYIICDCEYFKTKNFSFSVIINNYKLTIPSETLYDKLNANCLFKIMRNGNEDAWILDNVYMDNFDIEFHYDTGEITFYSDQPFQSLIENKENRKVNKSIFEIIIGIIIPMILLLSYVKKVF